MKNMIKLPAMVLGLLLLITGISQKAMAQDDDISLETFYQELAPYGSWLQDPEYGYVWRPDVDQRNFRPYYTDGRWAMTEYGNTWVSDYEWGWAPFHYGRWVLNRFNDWIWIPDTVWGPAWVSWRSGGGYYGWAPLGPGFDISIGFGGGYSIPNDWWVFIPQINIYNTSYPRYINRNSSIFGRTSYINYTHGRNRNSYYTGPRVNDIRRVTNRNVTVYNINRSNRPGRTNITNNNINIYNPRGGRPGQAGNQGRPGNNDNNNGRPGQAGNQGRPGNNDNNDGRPGRGGNQGRPGNNDNNDGRPDRGGNQGRPGNNDTNNGRPGQSVTPGQSTRPTRPGRDNNMQRPPENGRERIQPVQQGDNEQQRQQRENQQRQQREGQQRQEQQQRESQQRQQREGQQRQEQQQRENQQRQQREGQQRQEQQQRESQQRQQQQQQQSRPTRSETQTPPPTNNGGTRPTRGGRG
jgi:hypothetical protein